MQAVIQWPSWSDEVALADHLLGPLVGEQEVANWLAEQVRLIDDAAFADEFAALVQLLGGLSPRRWDVASLSADGPSHTW